MTALAYEQFELPWSPPAPTLRPAGVRSRLERVPSDPSLARRLQEYRELARGGWSVTALLAPDSKTVVLLACKAEAAPVRATSRAVTVPSPTKGTNRSDANPTH